MPKSIRDHSRCIDELIISKEKYPYYYWFIWILFLMSLAAFLTFNLLHDMPFNETTRSNTITQRTRYTANYNDLIEYEAFGQKIFLSTGHSKPPIANNHQLDRHRAGIIN